MTSRLSVQILVITITRVVINTMFRFVYPFLPVLGRGLGVDLGTMSRALSARSFAGAAGPFLAALADSRGRKFGMLFGMTLFIAGLAAVVSWPTYTLFLVALLVTSLGKSVFDPAIQAYLGDRVTYDRRGLALGLTEFGWSLSFIIGAPVMGLLIARGGWLAPFPVLALAGLVCLVALVLLIPGHVPPTTPPPGMWRNLHTVLTSQVALLALSLGLLISGANEMVNLVFGVWLEGSFGLKIAALGSASLVIGLAELGGETLVSGLTDRIGKTRAVSAGVMLNGLAALALPLLGRSLGGALVGLFLFYLTFEFSLVSLIPLMSEVMPQARATLLATNAAAMLTGRALAALLAPQIYSYGIMASGVATALINLLAIFGLQVFRRLASGEVAEGAR